MVREGVIVPYKGRKMSIPLTLCLSNSLDIFLCSDDSSCPKVESRRRIYLTLIITVIIVIIDCQTLTPTHKLPCYMYFRNHTRSKGKIETRDGVLGYFSVYREDSSSRCRPRPLITDGQSSRVVSRLSWDHHLTTRGTSGPSNTYGSWLRPDPLHRVRT